MIDVFTLQNTISTPQQEVDVLAGFGLKLVGRSWPGACPASPCAGCTRTPTPRRSAPRLGSDRPPAGRLRPLLLPCSCTAPGSASERRETGSDEQETGSDEQDSFE